ncbi:hypothetical protein MAR_037646 [Mya arenaria]|uniref:Uncharacterized protein n=1 Tax=Mya arenaria TaxID=6604 RepID=A0ABY7FPB1_MYAAR|nr:hypothetical protein MAR_037646 [Mya arenaria]
MSSFPNSKKCSNDLCFMHDSLMKRERHLSAVLFIHLLTSKIMFAQIVPRLNISLPPININTGNKPFTFSGTPIVSSTGRLIGGTAGINWKPAGSNTGSHKFWRRQRQRQRQRLRWGRRGRRKK